MKIRILSDLHFEFHADFGKSFIDSMNSECDVLVIAGDMATNRIIYNSLNMLCSKFKRVVYVHGNHEYYGSNRGDVNITMSKSIKKNSNLTWLNENILYIEGHRIIGLPLWFQRSFLSERLQRMWSDFHYIANFKNWVYEQNTSNMEFLNKELRKDDIVITHYLPSQKSVHEKFHDSETNAFFVCDMEQLIVERCPKLWIHGHTHDSFDYKIGSTRVVCNPFGYANHSENPNFIESMDITV